MRIFVKQSLTLLVFAASATTPLALTEVMHPDIRLLDFQGQPVVETGQPMSTVATCADCHDGNFITANHDHPLHIASNCLLCHSDDYDATAYFNVRNSAAPSWAAMSGLGHLSLAEQTDDGWQWASNTIDRQGEISAAELGLTTTKSSVCGSCHGVVYNNHEPLVIDPTANIGRLTGNEGAIYSGQRLSDSGLNIPGKAEKDRTFDVHAERLLECTDCHRAANNPVHGGAHGSNLSHLTYDPRQADLSDFLERPDHNLVIGAAGNEGECKGCHAPEANHSWLEEADSHFAALSCQACHINELYGPALQLVDDSVRDRFGNSLKLTRSTNGVAGFRPLLLKRPEDGKYAPFNIILTRYWRDAASNEAISAELIDQAWFKAGIAPVSDSRPITDNDITALQSALQLLGIEQPEIATIIKPVAINHGVSRDSDALSDCAACHSEDGLLQATMPLARMKATFELPSSLSSDAMPAMRLKIDENDMLVVMNASDTDYRLSSNAPLILMGGGLFGILGGLVGWQWFRRSRR